MIKEVTRIAKNKYAGKEVSIFTIGKKGNDILSKDISIYQFESDLYDDLLLKIQLLLLKI